MKNRLCILIFFIDIFFGINLYPLMHSPSSAGVDWAAEEIKRTRKEVTLFLSFLEFSSSESTSFYWFLYQGLIDETELDTKEQMAKIDERKRSIVKYLTKMRDRVSRMYDFPNRMSQDYASEYLKQNIKFLIDGFSILIKLHALLNRIDEDLLPALIKIKKNILELKNIDIENGKRIASLIYKNLDNIVNELFDDSFSSDSYV